MATSTQLTARERVRFWLGLAATVLLIGLAIVAGALYLGLPGRLDADSLEAVLEPAISSATRGLYGIEIGHVEAGISSRDLVVHDVRIAPRPEAIDRLAAGGGLPALRFTLEVDRFEIRGVDRGALLTGQGLLAERIEVGRPIIRATLDPRDGSHERDLVEPPSGTRETAEKVAAWVDENLRGVPELRVDTVAIRESSGTLAWVGAAETEGLRVGRVDITFVNLHIHEKAGREGFRSLFSDDVRLQASGFDLAADGGAGWRLGSLALSTGEQTAAVTDVRFDPGITVPEYLARASVDEPDRQTLWIGRVAAAGLDFQRLIGTLDLDMERLTVRGLRVEVLDDRHKPSSGPDREPATMPHDLVRELDVGLNVDTVEIRDGYVSYSERHPEAPRPGTIVFENVSATVSNLSNDPRRMTADEPAIWKVEASVYGVAPLSLTVAMPLLEPPPTMRLEGTVGSFGAELLNPILVPLTGMQLRDGDVLGVAFDLAYGPHRADGSFRAEYRGLRLSPVDRASGERDLKDVIVGFVASRLAIHDDNVGTAGAPARTAAVHYRIDPRDPFFKILWEPLRDGVRDLVRK